jgi:hypothetical protein
MKKNATQLKREKLERDYIRKSIESNNKLYKILKERSYGIESESINLVATPSNRTASERRNDKNTVVNELKNKVYNLFDNDPDDSQYFMNNFNSNPDSFNVVYPQLVQLFKGNNPDPDNVIATANNLVNNLQSTGSMNTVAPANNNLLLQNIENVKQFLSAQIQNGNVNAPGGNDMSNVLSAIFKYENSYDLLKKSNQKEWLKARQKISEDVNDLVEIMISDKSEKTKLKEMVDSMQLIKNKVVDVANTMTPEAILAKKQKEEKKEEAKKQKEEAKKQKEEAKIKKALDRLISEYNKNQAKIETNPGMTKRQINAALKELKKAFELNEYNIINDVKKA